MQILFTTHRLISIIEKTPIHIQYTVALKSATAAAPCELLLPFPTLEPVPLLVSIVEPGIRVKALAEAFSSASVNKGLFSASQEDRLAFAGIELETSIGRSNMVY
jgi:hypothetical protein